MVRFPAPDVGRRPHSGPVSGASRSLVPPVTALAGSASRYRPVSEPALLATGACVTSQRAARFVLTAVAVVTVLLVGPTVAYAAPAAQGPYCNVLVGASIN